jgi:hypothetical protein
MIEKDDPLRLRIEVLRVLARTNERNRAVLIERNIDDYLKTAGSATIKKRGRPGSRARIGYCSSWPKADVEIAPRNVRFRG